MSKAMLDFTPWPEHLQQEYRAKGYWSDEPLGKLLDKNTVDPEKIALIVGEQQWTYQSLSGKANQLAAGFIRLGLKPGARVVVQLPNCGELFEVLFALFRVGVAPVLALPTHRFAEVSYFCSFAEADAYITCATCNGFDHRELARQLHRNHIMERIIIVGEAEEFCALDSLYQMPGELPVVNANDVALYQLSGGTTGVPKLIPRTHNDYFYSIRESAHICAINAASVYLAVLPVVHNFPLSSPGALGVLWAGGTVVLAESGAPDVAFPLIAQHKVTITAMVPPLALTWLTACEQRQKSAQLPALEGLPALESLEIIQVGGAKLCESAARRVKSIMGCQLQQVFGMAEGLVNYTRLDDDDEIIITTQGRPISPDDDIRILDDDDQPVAVGVTGNLLTRGPYTIRGYFRAPEHNLKAFTSDGFYRTGDRVRMTEQGYLIVEGRAKDQINRGGEKIAAEEIENYLLTHPRVQDAALVAMPDPFLGERSCAFIALRPTSTAAEKPIPLRASDIQHYLRELHIASYKIPDRIEFIPTLPQTRLGKVDKKYLREWIAEKLERTNRINT